MSESKIAQTLALKFTEKYDEIIYKPILDLNIEFDLDKHWNLQWIQQILICFIHIYNPLLSPDFNEYSYRSQIIDRLLSDLFVNTILAWVIIGRVDNENHKEQETNSSQIDKKLNGHDIIYTKFKKFQIGFAEIARDAFIKDEKKMKK
ncbi:3888_t:CDS:2 [Gigaspora margarita]|uniref:3888_t:CDS:1 n=1 Tax=Gigaspora margarita TaxID=4874 RepID=A0ABN7WZJ5_GIGMA|nr:3888_t:CDS:2 [Gigaspora margarita]